MAGFRTGFSYLRHGFLHGAAGIYQYSIYYLSFFLGLSDPPRGAVKGGPLIWEVLNPSIEHVPAKSTSTSNLVEYAKNKAKAS